MPSIFEIHFTTEALTESALPDFIAFCKSIEAKPILIELPTGQQRQQPMISKVVTVDEPNDIHAVLAELQEAFITNGYNVTREKVEVPLECEAAGKTAFPDFHGGYYEWHGKVEVKDPEQLLPLLEYPKAHLSKNRLKGADDQRFITLRTFEHTRHFSAMINRLTTRVTEGGFEILKSEAEYCCYDSNKEIDRGWSDVPAITDWHYLELLLYEGFLRRSAQVDAPFMLKGSMVSRQYLDDPSIRVPGDLDFVYLRSISTKGEAERLFSNWVQEITEVEIDDGLDFRDFSENRFWRRIDYAMNDDFPTANTDLLVYLPDGTDYEVHLDISWNLPVPHAPTPLVFKTLKAMDFVYPLTVPLSLQIAWKLHQTLVRARGKDLVDLMFLVKHPSFTEQCRIGALSAFFEECEKDQIHHSTVTAFLRGETKGYNSPKANPKELLLSLVTTFPTRHDQWKQPEDLVKEFVRAMYQAGVFKTTAIGKKQNKRKKGTVLSWLLDRP